MEAVLPQRPGGPEELSVRELPAPVRGRGQVLLDVVAAGVNRADVLQRRGFYPPPPGASDILGLECSGVVADSGPDGGPAVGSPVCALLSGGGYASRVAVPVGQVMPLPPGVDLLTAAGVPEVAATVYSNLALTARLRAGEWLLVHGGASGIGTFAIQWARARGARVVVTVGSDRKARACLDLGADAAINYREQDFPAVVREVTGGHGADVVLDIIGAKYLEANLRSLAVGGRIVTIGLQGGTRAELDLGRLLSVRGTIHATSLRARSDEEKARICRGLVAEVWPMFGRGEIRPVVDRVFPLAAAAAAHEWLEDSAHVGKVLLAVEPLGQSA